MKVTFSMTRKMELERFYYRMARNSQAFGKKITFRVRALSPQLKANKLKVSGVTTYLYKFTGQNL